ncbi:coiled-coil domain-containing protein 174-like [Amphiura filiformis]|uniref:coiled-coil domain-containing protein 174-like n=1 Tax=Amphiura filiformis TaxID=82378 RepID=UPI003B228901
MDGRKKIGVNESSIVGLKAELFRKQEEFKRERLQNAGSSSTSRPKSSVKKANIWSKKNAGVDSRAERDTQLTSEEEDTLARSQSILAAKAKLYEKMTGGNIIPDESTNERFLVDFEKKVVDKIHAEKEMKEKAEDEEEIVATVPTREEMMMESTEDDVDDSNIPPPASVDEEWVDYVDSLGRSRRCMRKDVPHLINMDKDLNPDKFREDEKKEKLGTDTLPDLLSQDMYREMLRKKWETEAEEAAKKGPGPVHYQNVKFDEVRELGVGYFDFSKDETQRQEQMESLQMLRDETVDQRARREQLKAKRKAAMQARLAKVKQRNKLKGDIPGLDDEEENKDAPDDTVEERSKDALEDRLADKSYDMLLGKSKKEQPVVREWDIGKDPNLWEEAKKKARDERLSEFAPPNAYFDSPQQERRKPANVQSYHEKSSQNTSHMYQQHAQTSSTASKSNAEKLLSSAEFSYVPRGEFKSFQSTKKNSPGTSKVFDLSMNKRAYHGCLMYIELASLLTKCKL